MLTLALPTLNTNMGGSSWVNSRSLLEQKPNGLMQTGDVGNAFAL